MNYSVGLVLDDDYGDRLLELAETLPVWAPDSDANRAAAERYWASNPGQSLDRGITLYRRSGELTSPEDLIPVLDDIERYHGSPAHEPGVSVLDVYSCTARVPVIDALASAGYAVIETRDDRLRAARADRYEDDGDDELRPREA